MRKTPVSPRGSNKQVKLANKLSAPLLLALGAISILGPFGTDVYLPAFPQIADSLHTSSANVQLTLTAFTVGMAVGQLFIGALSDRIGRRRLIIAGCLTMFVASGVASTANSIWVLLLCCTFIGVAAAAGMVCSRAMVSDLASGNEAARGFSVLGIIAGIGPILGPVGGAFVMGFSDWRGIFGALSLLAFGFSLLAFFCVPESLDLSRRHSGGLLTMFVTLRRVLGNANFVLHSVVLWAGFAMMFAYISASPFVLQNVFSLTPLEYTLDFGANGVALMITGFLSASLVKVLGPSKQVLLGVGMQLLAAAVLAGTYLFGGIQLWAILVAFALIPSSMGFVFGPVTSLALREVRDSSGTALALLGAVQFVVAGFAAYIVGLGGALDTRPLIWILTSMSLAALLPVLLLRLRKNQPVL